MRYLAIAILLALCLPGAAQTSAVPAAPTSQAVLPTYRLGPDDTLSIRVINFDNLDSNVIVPPDGNIVVPLLNPIRVTGMTIDELKQTLVDQWRRYVIDPSVSVTLTQKRKESVLFYGFVSKAGNVDYRPGRHLIEALAEVGGAAQNGDLAAVVVTRKSGERVNVDISHPETKGGTSADVLMEPGDVVYVPELHAEISVLGEVMRPGSVIFHEDMTVTDAITESGGVRDTADLAQSSLTHNGTEMALNLEALLRHGDMRANIKLSAGDRILVPEIRNRVYVFGAVAQAGYYPYKDGDRMLDSLKAAGGPGKDANLRNINLIRIDKATNKSSVQRVNIDVVLKKGKMENNVFVQSGDIIYVPESKRSFGLQDVWGVAAGLNVINLLMNIL